MFAAGTLRPLCFFHTIGTDHASARFLESVLWAPNRACHTLTPSGEMLFVSFKYKPATAVAFLPSYVSLSFVMSFRQSGDLRGHDRTAFKNILCVHCLQWTAAKTARPLGSATQPGVFHCWQNPITFHSDIIFRRRCRVRYLLKRLVEWQRPILQQPRAFPGR